MKPRDSLFALAATAALALSSAACAPPRDQWLVTLSTNAPVPELGDRLLIEIEDDDGVACSGCRRLVDASHPSSWPISFGIEATFSTRRVRVRLFRSSILGTLDTPQSGLLIDSTVTLPFPSGITQVSIPLSMDCFGIQAGLYENRTCDPALKALAPIAEGKHGDPLRVGTWVHAAAVPCNGVPPLGMVCVPGGAFVLGDIASPALSSPDTSKSPEHLVLLSPFFLDRTELGVAEARILTDDHPELKKPSSPGAPLVDHSAFCTYDPAADGDLPVNCLDHAMAEAFCEAQGARLPSEAEWEFAAGNRTAETPFPWGDAEDVCNRAIVERGDVSLPSHCRTTGNQTLPAGPVAGGSPADVTQLGIRDMGGSVAEWVADAYEQYDGDCWSGAGLLEDPSCASDLPDAVVRGGSYGDVGADARAITRRSVPRGGRSSLIGVRCAKDAL